MYRLKRILKVKAKREWNVLKLIALNMYAKMMGLDKEVNPLFSINEKVLIKGSIREYNVVEVYFRFRRISYLLNDGFYHKIKAEKKLIKYVKE